MESLEKWKSISIMLSGWAVPVVIAIIGWTVQKNISDNSLKKDYLGMAIQILQGDGKDAALRNWALEVVDKTAPVPFSASLRSRLLSGAVALTVVANCPKPPSLPESIRRTPTDQDQLSRMELILRQTSSSTDETLKH